MSQGKEKKGKRGNVRKEGKGKGEQPGFEIPLS
jgi:hypothetical protein